MRIFIISRGYPTEKHITNGIFEYDQAKALAALGHEVVFIALDLRSLRKKRKMGSESFVRDNIHIEAINIPISDFSKRLVRSVREKSIKKLYRRCVEKYGVPDIIHAHFQEIAYSTAVALKDEGVPMVMTEHTSKLNNTEIPADLQKTGEKTYRYFDRVITVGKELAKTLREKFGVDSVLIPNIVDLDSFKYNGSKEKKAGDPFTIISVGSLKKRKRMDDLINAFSVFHEQYEDARLRIFGIGPERENLQSLIDEKKLGGCVTLEGRKQRTEIAEAMEEADCFALSSDTETFGVAYIEAMAMGLPVIATRSRGPEDFVEDYNGLLVDPGDLSAMTDAMEYMRLNKDRYDSDQISKRIKEKFSPEVIAEQIESVYSAAIQTKE